MTENQTTAGAPGAGAGFAETRWSVVLRAADTASPQAGEALAALCQAYWYPLYVFIRRQGHNPHDAQDLTQEFFARLIQSHFFAAADPKRGRFRSFLLASLKHFLQHEWEKARAQRRGGGRAILSLDAAEGESRYLLEPAQSANAERLFDRRWALTLLERVVERLRADYAASGKAELFDALKPALAGEQAGGSCASLAASLGMTEGAVKVAIHRLRQRYGALLREEISHTLASPDDVEGELRHLFDVLGG